jgi:hypothetical protein
VIYLSGPANEPDAFDGIGIQPYAPEPFRPWPRENIYPEDHRFETQP